MALPTPHTELRLQDNAASTALVATEGSNGVLQGGDNTSAKSVEGPGGLYPLALKGNGSDDYFDSAINGSDLPGASFTVTFHFKLAAATQQALILIPFTNTTRLHLVVTATPIFRMFVSGTTPTTVDGPEPEADKWYHAAIVVDHPNTDVHLYLDGELIGSVNGTVSTTASTVKNCLGVTFASGVRALFSSAAFAGWRFYDVALSETQVEEDMALAEDEEETTTPVGTGRAALSLGLGL